MSEQEPSFGRDEVAASEQSGAYEHARVAPFTPAESLADARPEQQPAAEQSHDVVDDLLSHAAQTVETFLSEVKATQAEITRLESSQESHDGHRDEARSPEALVGEVLLTARRVADEILAEAHAEARAITVAARRDAAPTLTEAHSTLQRAAALHHQAHAVVSQAQAEAALILDSARAERDQLIAGAMSEATRRREELELSNARLETAIKDLRTEWAGRAIDALVRLEGLGLDASPSPDETAGRPAELEDESEPERPEWPELPSSSSPFEP